MVFTVMAASVQVGLDIAEPEPGGLRNGQITGGRDDVCHAGQMMTGKVHGSS